MTSIRAYPHIQRLAHRLMPWLLACALLVAQTLGFMHGVLHAKHPLSGGGAYTSLQAADKTGSAPSSFLGDLFSSHNGDNDCRLYDQASHGSAAMHVAPLTLPVVLPSFAVAIFQCEALARWAALFDARGPPLTS